MKKQDMEIGQEVRWHGTFVEIREIDPPDNHTDAWRARRGRVTNVMVQRLGGWNDDMTVWHDSDNPHPHWIGEYFEPFTVPGRELTAETHEEYRTAQLALQAHHAFLNAERDARDARFAAAVSEFETLTGIESHRSYSDRITLDVAQIEAVNKQLQGVMVS